MNISSKLFDTNGHLLPPEKTNIRPLDPLTKGRAKSPSRRSPSRLGRQSSGSELKLPNFVQEVTQNSESSGDIRVASPTAVRAEYFTVEKHRISTDTSPSHGKHLINHHLAKDSTSKFKLSVLSKSKGKFKMESGISNEGAVALELLEKPVLSWTIEDVGIWLDEIGLNKLKEHFIDRKVSGRTLLNLSYETLEELNLSESSEEREHFLSEVYHLQQESGHIDDEEEQMMDKEIEETLRGGVNGQENGHDRTHILVSGSSDLTPTDSFASSKTASDNTPSPTSEMSNDAVLNSKDEPVSPKSTDQNKPEPSRHTITSNQLSPTKIRAKKDSSKQTSKKTKPRGTRISRLFNSRSSHKDPSLLKTAPPIYKNAFHNLMNTGPQGVIKVWTEMFLTDMQYVSLLVKHEATAFEVIKMVLEKSNAKEDPECYRICEINEHKKEYILDRNECPLQRERKWSDPDNCRFELRWRNERLIEWGSTAEDLSKRAINEEPPHQGNQDEVQPNNTSSPPSSVSTSEGDSPLSNEKKRNNVMETEFAYVVQLDNEKEEKESEIDTRKSEVKEETTPNDSQNALDPYKAGDPDSLQNAPVRLVSSCPDLSKKDAIDGDPEYGNLIVSKNFGFLNAEMADLTAIDDEPTTNLDSSSSSSEEIDTSPTVNEFEYSQQLRRSSKRLSDRLRFQGKPIIEGQAVEIGINASNLDETRTVKDSIDGNDGEIGKNGGLSIDRSEGSNGLPGDLLEITRADLSAGGENASDISEAKVVMNGHAHVDETTVEQPGSEAALPGNEVSPPVISPEVLKRIEELENENLLLIEDNRELKKNCRTFEGRSRLKERELEEMELEKNDLTHQVQHMAVELHSLRATNTELRAEVDEANTKLGDVDGWVTRDVFEDIRGQLSVSAEECDKKDEEIREIEKKCKNLEMENKKMQELEMEVDKLNERIKEDGKATEETRKKLRDKEKSVLELELKVETLENSLQEKEGKLAEVEAEAEGLRKTGAEVKKDLQKRVSDREYEILIMKEEKKELCVKMKSFESNVETLREEMKKKDAEHEEAIAEIERQTAIKDESLSVMVSNLEELVNERDMRIKQLKNQIALSGTPQSELEAREHEYEQNKAYLKHLIALVREKDPTILDGLNKSLSSRDSEDWC
ncbi:uncharacterized protein LOC114520591 [Dendronephthya gigantea]|uniref:uncharacterized protein LOC114520591 n=1 Tax=Dendronephthya gigantea TaxID=151771 RepID=UPI00106DC235|nr:uncharacterized protein LOC114520591 [Dendronephthya gigantea]